MKPNPPKQPDEKQKLALAQRLLQALADIRDSLGVEAGEPFARKAFDEAIAATFEKEKEPTPAAAWAAPPTTRAGFRHDYGRIIGESPAILGVLAMLERIIDSDLPVLITGESGTGKELVARAIHENGVRKDRHFVRENCAAIPESLLESELFGYRRGAFTGATHDKKGLFEEGDGGTLFLDEVAEMSLNMQAKLMRVLQEGEIRPVGSPTSLRVDVRLISATNRDLRKCVAAGRFREDLFFRLNVLPIHVPPLRERPEDIPLLAAAFLDAAAARRGAGRKELASDVMPCLVRHAWPGNVRELENEIQRASALSGPVIRVADLSPELQPAPGKPARSSNPKSR